MPTHAVRSAAAEPPRHHVAISGTGRAGTTFLVELLTTLGLDTGYSTQDLARRKDPVARAGLEHDLEQPGAPYIVKAPGLCDRAQAVLAREDLRLDHLFVPMRSLFDAAESRRRVTRERLAAMSRWRRFKVWLKGKEVDGGVTGTREAEAQEAVLQARLYRLMQAAAEHDVPVTLLHFPRLVQDPIYLYRKLLPLVGAVPYMRFEAAFRQTAQPALVHRFAGADAPAMAPRRRYNVAMV